ncbi:MAG: hypothetical protein AAFZ67_08015 [Planctomycetota bacterium]
MGFYSSLKFYLPFTKPPRITGPSLVEFIRGFNALEVNPRFRRTHAKLIPGFAIDRDVREMTTYEPYLARGSVFLSKLRRQPGIIEVGKIREQMPYEQYLDGIAAINKPIYRFFTSLGGTSRELSHRLTKPSDDNEEVFTPDSWSLEIGPVRIGTPETADAIDDALGHEFAGWIAISISGNGYAFPRTHRQVVDEMTAEPELRAVADHVRSFWPIADPIPSKELIKLRQVMGDAYTGDSCEARADWLWGVYGI